MLNVQVPVLTVACAVISALVPCHCGFGCPVPHLTVAVALVRELDPGQRESLRCAEARARRTGHRGTSRGRSRQGSAARAFCDASDLCPASRKRSLSGDEGRGAQSGTSGPRARSIPERVASREHLKGRREPGVFGDDLGLENACVRGSLVEVGGERGTVHDVSDNIRTLVDGVLQEVAVPAVLEVTVMAVTGSVSIREDPSARPPVVELVDGGHHLIEQRDELDGVGIGAVATVEVLNGVGHMGLVV